jgi:hypothetical protein
MDGTTMAAGILLGIIGALVVVGGLGLIAAIVAIAKS